VLIQQRRASCCLLLLRVVLAEGESSSPPQVTVRTAARGQVMKTTGTMAMGASTATTA